MLSRMSQRFYLSKIPFPAILVCKNNQYFPLIQSFLYLTCSSKECLGGIVAKYGIFRPFINRSSDNSFSYLEEANPSDPFQRHSKFVKFFEGLKFLVDFDFFNCSIDPNLIFSILYNFSIRKNDELL
jgi:hypothetical protein